MMMASRRRSVGFTEPVDASTARGAATNDTALASSTPSDADVAISRCRGGERSIERRRLGAGRAAVRGARPLAAAPPPALPTLSIAAFIDAAALAAASASGVPSSAPTSSSRMPSARDTCLASADAAAASRAALRRALLSSALSTAPASGTGVLSESLGAGDALRLLLFDAPSSRQSTLPGLGAWPWPTSTRS
jgi:hypothetical protein